MGFMKSLFGNMGVQQEIPEKKIIIRDVGPNPAQVISIIQNYYPEDADQVSMLVNENMMEGMQLSADYPQQKAFMSYNRR